MILFVVRQIPYPPDTGARIRQLNLLAAYAGVCPVRLVFSYEHESELAGMRALERFCDDIHPVRFDWRGRPARPGLAHWRKDLRESRRLRSFQSGHFFSRAMHETVQAVAPSCRLIHVDSLSMVPHVASVLSRRRRRQRLILDLDDIETRARRAALRAAPPVGLSERVAETLDLLLLSREQARALRSFDRVLVSSEHDRRCLRNRPNLAVILNGTDIHRERLPDESDGKTLLCLGTYGHWPNVDGLTFFLREILPLIRAEVRDVRILVVGRSVPPEVARLHDGVRVQVCADVPSVEPFYRQATLSVVPLRVGAGTRLKILEAFALGRPVVSTSVGCEGLEVVNGGHLLVADEPATFARSCLDLLRDPDLRAQLVQRGRALVERRYSWESIRRRTAELATELLEAAPPPQSEVPGPRTVP